uniref:Uncharacterized protein n=1 Tax=Tanacetum cinerariifolium TaxID=118510 RepID=A0A6L2NME3_TANCI|nr:hypothetical protein [Tanacetum cinerariifolium]
MVEKWHPHNGPDHHQDEKTGLEKIEKVGYTVVMPYVDDTFDFVLVGYKWSRIEIRWVHSLIIIEDPGSCTKPVQQIRGGDVVGKGQRRGRGRGRDSGREGEGLVKSPLSVVLEFMLQFEKVSVIVFAKLAEIRRKESANKKLIIKFGGKTFLKIIETKYSRKADSPDNPLSKTIFNGVDPSSDDPCVEDTANKDSRNSL